MKKLAVLIAFIATTYSFAQTTWKVDPYHSKVSFSVSHLVISEVDGSFNSFDGSFISNKDDFSDAEITFEIDANSIDTDNAKRDGHLKSEDFFYVEKNPKITFTSTSFKKKSKKKYQLKGNLTMRGITKKVTLDVSHGGIIANDGNGNTKAGFKITGIINRIDFGVAWNAKTEHGGMVVGEDIEITVKLELVKKDTNVN